MKRDTEKRALKALMRAYSAKLKAAEGSIERLLAASETNEGRALNRACAAHAKQSRAKRK